jgi:hypothetical protein
MTARRTAARIDWVGVDHGLGLHHLPPARNFGLDILTPGPVLLALQARDERPQRGGGVPDEVDLVGIAHADVLGINIDLHRASLIEGRQELGIRKAGAHRQQRVAVPHHVVARPRPEQADRAGDIGQIVSKHVLAQQRLCHPGPEQLSDLHEFRACATGTRAGQDRHLLSGVENLRGPADRGIARHRHRPVDADAGRHHLELVCWSGALKLLHVRRDDDRDRCPLGQRHPDSPVQHVRQLLGNGNPSARNRWRRP